MAIITTLRTIRVEQYPNCIWVEVETDDGLVGLGEAWRGAAAIEAVVHSELADWLIGQDARRIEFISRTLLTPYLGFHSASAEVRAASAVDIALWDLFGKRAGIPVYEALGGASRTSLPVYNTCSGYSFNASSSAYDSGNARRVITDADGMRGPYDDQIAFTRDAGKLAESLLAEGYRVMKIWPFDPYAKTTQGMWISDEDLQAGMEPFRKIRAAVGNQMEVMCELHSLWSVPAARRICQALEEVDVFWAEDPLCKMDDVEQLRDLRAGTRTPICGSETLSSAPVFRRLLAEQAVDYAMLDLGWCGGLTEGRKIAALAESFNIPIAPHDCTGPVQLWAGLHLGMYAPTAMFQEVVRANLATWYQDLADALPQIDGGRVGLPERPGLGVELRPEVKLRPDAIIRES
ncbi:mandelate racemase/muconate lactonizing enzyme family protein [Collinsella ihumii]|uniref:Mandelate racemase/muconate lactonizing enzyme family protein n=1 Tax=Collinsella ihumii TaxID=1720204 RepID=A0AAW7JVZ8_9ACTN|nr:mandelate racemase/muconate lactonizing enzyme family protein [Collinsella ihumii]MDN0069938.1 mandelate racemase/muconate lactonizing enzyme family protein [Collinsella ihumii]